MRRVLLAALCMLCLLTITCRMPASAAHVARPEPERQTLHIVNASGEDVLGIVFQTGQGVRVFRFDMAPGDSETIDNPGGTADVRVDTGLTLWHFAAVPLEDSVRLTLHGVRPPVLELAKANVDTHRMVGEAQDLLPATNAKPACALQRFRPGMPVQEVCSILGTDTPRDDQGALLASLDFAGLVWAARLISTPPEGEKNRTAASPEVLTHLELRRRLDAATLKAVLHTLYARHYAPWQAELPGLDINFPRMPLESARRRELLDTLLTPFLAAGQGEATIMLAPADMLPKLAEADTPPSGDVHLFTVTARLKAHNLIVDVATYQEKDASTTTTDTEHTQE